MKGKKPRRYTEFLHLIRPSNRFRIVSEDPYVAEGRIAIPYRYFPGPAATRFFTALRDSRKILGLKCPECSTVYVPPEATCGRCFRRLDQWVEVKPEGRLISFTTTRYSLPVHPGPPPIIYGLVLLEGATTALVHLLGEVRPEDVRVGMRLRAVFKEEREGNILDIRYFRPAE